MNVVAKIKAKPGREQEIEKALLEILPFVEQEEGTLEYRLNRAMDNPLLFMVIEKYTDVNALTVHSSTPHFAKLFEKISSALDGKPEVYILEEIGSIKR